jgi:hypothetical protein
VIRALFAPKTPAEELAEERARIARKRPDLVLIDRRPDPDMFRWWSVADLIEKERGR